MDEGGLEIGEKTIIYNIFTSHNNSETSKEQAIQQTAQFTGISTECIHKILLEYENESINHLNSLNTKRKRDDKSDNSIPDLKSRKKHHTEVRENARRHSRGKLLELGEKTLVYNVVATHMKNGKSKTQAVNCAADETLISRNSVWRILGEKESRGFISPPNKRRNRSKLIERLSDEELDLIREVVDSFSLREEVPTVDKVYNEIKDIKELPHMCRTTVWDILKQMERDTLVDSQYFEEV